MLAKLISGKNRKTRLHDEKGHFMGWQKFFFHAPLAFSSGLLRLSVGHRPIIPWIAYDAIEILKDFLAQDSRVLEFGSGMSTVWYAKHAGEVCSVEDYRPWYDKVKKNLERQHLGNCNYHFAENVLDYITFMSNDECLFDLIMVDGSMRSACIENSIKLLKPGGVLYLDNSDKHSGPQGGDTRIAENYALAFAHEKKAEITYFTDFAPTQFFAQQGLMIRVPA